MGKMIEKAGKTETILIVDDEDMVINVGSEMLERLGYKVLMAKSGRDGVRIYETCKEEVSLVIMDLIMPEMGGIEAYKHIKDINPDVKVLFSTGYILESSMDDMMEKGKVEFIQKPFGMEELSRKVNHVLETG